MTVLQRRLLITIAPVAGAAVMIVEIIGAKLLAPYVGTSHFVWTAQIAVTMLALAAGYAIGGRLADRAGTPAAPLRPALLGAALTLVAGTLACEPVTLACLRLDLRAGSFLASSALFFLPLCLLATVPPVLVRTLAGGLGNLGRTVGGLSAVSTVGSVIGTLSAGWLLIPHFGNTGILLATAGVLALAALACPPSLRAKDAAPVAAALLLGAGLAVLALRRETLRLPTDRFTELHRSNSNFGQLQVLDDARTGLRYYLNDLLIQNITHPASGRSAAEFTHMLHGLARAYTPEIREALCIGMGVGIVPMQLAREGAAVDVVEINPAIVPVAEKWFGFERGRMRALVLNDGRPHLAAGSSLYDTILLDAFLGEASPSHLMTREAFAAMKRRLRENGTLVINAFGTLREGDNFFSASLEKTLASVFATVRLHATGDGNSYYVATDRPDARPLRPLDLSQIPPPLRRGAEAKFNNTVTLANAPGALVLTDDYNPVEHRDARNRERLRRQLALNTLQ
ncbi:MAG: fused MFS/spermidine synthase [Opitutaceae bacterium]|jgi:spermidine synthase|nr:fused MFS/spermidine synthase [Opitutaceae bacterium]